MGLFRLVDPNATLIKTPKYNQNINFIPKVTNGRFKSPSLEKLGSTNAFVMERDATNELSFTLNAVEHLEGNPTVFCCYDRSWGLVASLKFQTRDRLEFVSEFGSVQIHSNAAANMTISLGETASFNICGEEFSAYGIPKFIVFGSSLSTVQPDDLLKIGSFQVAVKNTFSN